MWTWRVYNTLHKRELGRYYVASNRAALDAAARDLGFASHYDRIIRGDGAWDVCEIVETCRRNDNVPCDCFSCVF